MARELLTEPATVGAERQAVSELKRRRNAVLSESLPYPLFALRCVESSDPGGARITWLNDAAVERFGPRATGARLDEVVTELPLSPLSAALARLCVSGEPFCGLMLEREQRVYTAAGWRVAEAQVGLLLVDVTEFASVRDQLRVTQRSHEVGTLVSGVAHDMNNVLSAIYGCGALALEALEPEHRAHRDLTLLLQTTERAEQLVAQLLAFTRRERLRAEPVVPAARLRELGALLSRLLGQSIHVEVDAGGDPASVQMEPGAFDQVVLNLAINARDAMPEGGRLVLKTELIGCTEQREAARSVVRLTVSDTGTGMSEEVRARIFEPFFTTKAEGQGTGLGLSNIKGIINQAGGSITVRSTPGEGSHFVVELPASGDAPMMRLPATKRAAQGEHVLVVEDDPALRVVFERTLLREGYRLSLAAGPIEARELCQSRTPDLLLIDLMLPGISGTDLAAELCAARPRMRVMYMSGYPNESIGRLLNKPFTRDELLAALRECLDAAA